MVRRNAHERKVRNRGLDWARLDALLFAHQQRLIDRAVGGATPAFRRYEAAYRAATAKAGGPITRTEVERELRRADVTYVGDYHTLREAQAEFLALATTAAASPRPLVLAVEFLELSHQPALDAFLAGRLSLATLAKRCGYRPGAPFDLFDRFAPILTFAKRRRLPVLAIDSRPGGTRSLQRRDALAADRIAGALVQPGRPRVLVLMGQYHVAPCHLPAAVAERAPHRPLVVYQNPEGPYWARPHPHGRAQVDALRLSRTEVALFSSSPLNAQRTFLDYAQPAGDAEATFRFVHRTLCQALGSPSSLPRDLAVEVGPPDVGAGALTRRSSPRVSRASALAALEGHDGRWVPAARLVWLATSAPHVLAREAARLIVQRSIGLASSFWAASWEECLALALAQVIAPDLRPQTLSTWRQRFIAGPREARPEAAFVLAQLAIEDDRAALGVTPPWPSPLGSAVSTALGRLAGSRLPLTRRRAVALLTWRPSAVQLRALLRRCWARHA